MQFRNLLIAALAALCVVPALADSRLVGRWNSLDANNHALRGTITIQKEGAAVLAAEGQPVLTGTWSEPGPGELVFAMGEYGTANLKYSLDKGRLVLTYDNGNVQTFTRQTGKKAATARKPAARAATEDKK